jgi:hypothetical protein
LVEEHALDAEEALTYATNPTNLRLRLASHAHPSEGGESEASQDPAAVGSSSEMDDMIER